ncbi:hypothetical protein [Streptomyces microflavus]|uniref:hypothetical protein n=1 Tax=Streptomyces microflavus TaxID=1919 RepID=UPI002E314125|nr:hypothetical protein [Streptomyces microflavus]
MAIETPTFRVWLNQNLGKGLCAMYAATPGNWSTPEELHAALHQRGIIDPVECTYLGSTRLRWIASTGGNVHICSDCGADSLDEYYMVKDEVWAAAGMCGYGYLCVGCVEGRLDRCLTAADFADVPINSDPEYQRSARLASRLAAS